MTGYFGDILSYSRLMTLMLAGSVIASVFNTLGAIPGNVVIFLIISALGNGLNFADQAKEICGLRYQKTPALPATAMFQSDAGSLIKAKDAFADIQKNAVVLGDMAVDMKCKRCTVHDGGPFLCMRPPTRGMAGGLSA